MVADRVKLFFGYTSTPKPSRVEQTVASTAQTVASTAKSSRLEEAIAARSSLAEDFFGGWVEADASRLVPYAKSVQPLSGKITDFLGIRHSNNFHPWATHWFDKVIQDVPIPDDSLRAEAIEYFALINSLETANNKSFTMIELGASYGPWTCASAVLSMRSGRKPKLTAVEASSFFCAAIPKHLEENGIDAASHDIRVVHGAISTFSGTMSFPKVSSASENGGRAVREKVDIDYVGRRVEHEEVRAYTLQEIMTDDVVDLLHVDVQGFEADLIASNSKLLNSRVRTMFVGTHSRKIEGLLLECLHENGWQLLRERPTKFSYNASLPDVIGWTGRDGGQYWVNPRH